jgi:hypothetical protein
MYLFSRRKARARIKDENSKIADDLKALVTPEIYVLNANFVVLYHGRMDFVQDLKKNIIFFPIFYFFIFPSKQPPLKDTQPQPLDSLTPFARSG